jgi:hypothetical protein
MLKGEVIDLTSKNKYNVSFFDDDSVDVVRHKIGEAMDMHPDRLHIMIGLKLPVDYYEKDPRHWEALFERLSYNGEPITTDIFSEYQLSYRAPTTAIPFEEFDRTTWMSQPDSLIPLFKPASEFLEYRIFGVEEPQSYVLSLVNLSNSLVARIPPVKIPIPENTKLFDSFYKPSQFVRFLVLPYNETAESNSAIYFPLLRTNTPSKLTEEAIRLMRKNSKTLNDLLSLEAPEPSEVTLVRTRFYIPWVNTDFGSAIRTRFEQIFYGLTVSEKVPCVTLFTSKDQVSRHKFYTEDPKQKKPWIDTANWSSWWSVKPARNIPALILFRGKGKQHYDRITITSSDMVVSTYRPEGNTETIDHIYRQIQDWISMLDAVVPFIDKSDLDSSRWELQDMSILAKYPEKLEEFDLLRFNCLSTLFDIGDKTKSQFSLLRTDHSNNGLSAVEVKILSMMKDSGGRLTPEAVSTELSIPIQNARELIGQVDSRLADDPRLGEKAFRGYPTLRITPEHVIISSVSNLEKSVKYSNLLRFVLSNPKSDALDEICPKRAEKVAAETSVVPTEEMELDAGLSEEYGDLFGFLEESEEVAETTSVADTEATTETTRISTEQKQGTTYNYFKAKLQKFDPVTFDPVGSQYAKKCEQQHQPIVMSDADIKRLAGTPYDIKDGKYAENQLLDTENPDGTFMCPEYWCMKDQIPLQESQLDKSDGEIKCPVCHGKLQTRSTDNPREFPLIKRETGFVYPGLKDYRAPRNGRQMPCCFKKPKTKGAEKKLEDKYYVLSSDKSIDEERIAFLQPKVINALHLNEKYELFASGSVRRLMSPNKGFFRAGLGHPSETLPGFLGVKTKIPSPRESVTTVLKCSFLNTWKRMGTKHLDHIENELNKMPEYREDDVLKQGLAKVISGLDEAFEKKELTALEELEYCAIALSCDVFRIYTDSATLGCMFYAPMVRPRSRGIVVLQNEDEVDILAYTERKSRGFEFHANIFESPFTRETYTELEKLRNQSCKTRIPSYNDALTVIPTLMSKLDAEDFEIILDPFGRGQAMYIPGKVILPFQSTPLPEVLQTKVSGYKEIPTEKLPEYEEMKKLLVDAEKVNLGFAFKEDLFNNHRQKVEILLESGLRIPVRPVDVGPRETGEVIETVRELGESKLVFGKESEDLREQSREISYAAEVYEFMLFQLTNDIESDYTELREALRQVKPKTSDVEPLLRKWFDETSNFVEMKEPKQFLSKIRKPCDESCDGELCAMDGDKCKVKINSALQKDKLFHRLFSTLIENSKIRAMVLDGRTTPFFSTILYLELPHEVIMTDSELPN